MKDNHVTEAVKGERIMVIKAEMEEDSVNSPLGLRQLIRNLFSESGIYKLFNPLQKVPCGTTKEIEKVNEQPFEVPLL